MPMVQGLRPPVSFPSSCARLHSIFSDSHWPRLTIYEAGAAWRCGIFLTKWMGSSGTNEDAHRGYG